MQKITSILARLISMSYSRCVAVNFIVTLFFLFAKIAVAQPAPPNVSVASPSLDASFLVGADVLLRATASDPNGSGPAGTITKVEFYLGTSKIGEDTSAPFNFVWSSVTAGDYQVKIKAFDNDGQSKESTIVNVTVHPLTASSSKKYYVKAGAANTNNGLSQSTPFPIIQRAANLANPGDSIFVMAGTYTNSCPTCNVVRLSRTGTPSRPIVLTNFPGDKPVITFNSFGGVTILDQAAYVVIRGFEIIGNNQNVTLAQAELQPSPCSGITGSANPIFNGSGIQIDGRNSSLTQFNRPNHITMEKNNIHDCGCAGVGSIGGADYSIVQDNIIYNNAWYSRYGCSGITFNNLTAMDPSTGYHNFIRRNISFNNRMYIPFDGNCKIEDGNGVIIDRNDGSLAPNPLPQYTGRTLVENNVVAFNGGSGIHAFRSSHVDIMNNTAYMNSQSEETSGDIFAVVASDVNVFNNIIIPIPGESASFKNGTNLNFDYNLYFGTASTKYVAAPNNVVGDPGFINPTNNPILSDFRIKNTSAAIDKGTLTNSPLKDYSGLSRPQGAAIDIGAFEYVDIANLLPEVLLTSPNDNQLFSDGALIQLAAKATDTDGTITKVEFFEGSTKLGETSTFPYIFDWTEVPNGSYELAAKAYDNKEGTAISSIHTIIINGETIIEDGAIMQAFTPNGDGQNDIWQIEGLGSILNPEVKIYNDKGQLIYNASPYSNNWDGTKDGKPLPVGAYYFVLKADGKEVKKGSFLLLR